ncbi:MAG: hypothetical protein Q8T13_01210 [Acidobacteriota bacterium]|nr:hypothetical protein [Acidobacteriota bacterium]
MSVRVSQLMMSLAIAVLAAGCSSPPTSRVDAAKSRLDALGPEAKTHAPEAFAEAQGVVAQLDAELATQSESFAMSRSYDRTGQLIDQVNAAADRVQTAIETGKRQAAAQAESARRAETERAEAEKEAAAAAELAAAVPEVRPGQVALPRAAMADGKRLAAGTYSLRLGDEAPAAGATMRAGRWVEFVSNGSVAGRGLAVVIPDSEISEVTSGSSPRNEAWVAELRGGEYVRVWLNRGGVHYLLHLPTS